jgi:tetratricopeptide (TPR) repeat protein
MIPNRPSLSYCARLLLGSFLLLFAATVFAQQQPWDAPAFSADAATMLKAAGAIPKDKKADAVVLLEDIHVSVDESGRATETYRMVYRVDTPNGVDHWASLSSRYSPWYQARPVMKARVITPDGVAHELDPKVLSDHAIKDDDSDNIYTDDHELEGPFPAVGVGSVVEEQTVIQDTSAFFEGSWSGKVYFGRSVPVMHSTLTLEAPASRPLQYVTRLLPDVQIRKSESDGTQRVVFDQGRLENDDTQSFLPPETPRNRYVAITTAPSWQDVVTRYLKRVEAQIRPDQVASLVAGIKGSPDEVLSAILAKMHANARYTGIEFGESAIIPQPPSETLKRKYGDCKDKAALLVSMLRAAGIPANLVLLNAGSDHDVDTDIPGLTWFNHAIVYLPTRDLFIDATAEYSRFRELPTGDQGRLALVVAENTKELKRIPDLPSSANGTTEKREVYLAEFGPARVVETSQWFGPSEASLRSSFDGGESKQERKRLEDYVKRMYLADSLTKYEHTDATDLNKPFSMRLEVDKAHRGSTDLDNAVAAIRIVDLISQRLPDEILSDEKKDNDNTPAEDKRKPRTEDWYMNSASVAEWDYTIVPPPGYSVRGLPESKTTHFGPTLLTETYKTDDQGVVRASLRFDTVKRRYTVAEVSAIRESWKQFQNHGVTIIYFDLTGSKLVQQGKVKEGVGELRKLAATHPNEGLHRAQLARAFLNAGLGDLAREQANEAVKLDPKSDVAEGTLGYVLLHDVFGRQFKKGWDRAGAIAAYRKAKELDPKNTVYRTNLALALEYNDAGERYAADADLKSAIAEYKELSKIEDVDLDDVNDRLVYTMAYAGEFKDLSAELHNLGRKPLYNAMRVLCASAREGPEAGVKLASELTDGEQARSNALATAGTVAMRARMYSQAQVLLAAAAAGQQNAGAMANLAQVLGHVRRYDEIKWNDNDPGMFVLHLTSMSLGANHDWRKVLPYLGHAFQELPQKQVKTNIQRHWFGRLGEDLPRAVTIDLGMTLVKTSVEGDDANGYRVTLKTPGTPAEHVYLVREQGALKFLGDKDQRVAIGQEVMDRIARNQLQSAKVLLDWVREDVKLTGGEDPFAGSAFPRLWSKGQDADAGRMRVAAAVLLSDMRGTMKGHLPELVAERDKAASDADKLKISEALLLAYIDAEDWPNAEAIGRLLLKNAASPTVLNLTVIAMERQKKWSELIALIEQLRPKLPDEMAAVRLLAHAYSAQNDPATAMKVLKPYIDSGKAELQDMNQYGWAAVMKGNVSPDVLQVVQQSVQEPKNQYYALMHTLACMYAVAGRAKEAQQLLLATLKLDPSVDEPLSEIWYGYARLAESYGEYTAAAKLYERVEKPEMFADAPEGTYALAQHRLLAMSGGGKAAMAAGK